MFDESLKYRKIPPVISGAETPEINGKLAELRPRAPASHEPRALRRRTWNREEVSEKFTFARTCGVLTLCIGVSFLLGRFGQPPDPLGLSAVHQDQAVY